MIKPSDAEFRYLGLSEAHITLLAEHPNHVRQAAYDEALRLLMEEDSKHDSLPEKLRI